MKIQKTDLSHTFHHKDDPLGFVRTEEWNIDAKPDLITHVFQRFAKEVDRYFRTYKGNMKDIKIYVPRYFLTLFEQSMYLTTYSRNGNEFSLTHIIGIPIEFGYENKLVAFHPDCVLYPEDERLKVWFDLEFKIERIKY